MPLQLSCPSCGTTLRVGDDLLGRKVRCPKCATTFTAGETQPPAEGGAIQKEEPSPKPPPEPRDEGIQQQPPPEDELPTEEEPSDEDAPRRRGRRSNREDESSDPDVRREKRPHHGPLVMGLGISSIVASLLAFPGICCCGGIGLLIMGLLGVGLGVPAWLVGQRDLAAMRSGEMSWEGESSTKAGWICGIIGTVVGGLAILGGCGLTVLYISAQIALRGQ